MDMKRVDRQNTYPIIAQDYKDGMTPKELALKYQVNYKRIWQILKMQGVETRETRGAHHLTKESREQARVKLIGELNYSWKGGRKITSKGYIMLINPDRFMEGQPRYIFEHRFVMENMIGRKLEKNEHVHHINGIKSDNRPENLVIKKSTEHFGDVICPCCSHRFRIR